jgi:signal peptidase II
MTGFPRSRYVLFLCIALVGCAADLATKHWAFRLPPPPPVSQGENSAWWLIKGTVGLQTSLNEGALFGMGQGKVAVFATLSIAAALAILWWLFVTGAARDGLLTAALGCVTAGIMGNLYDRLGFSGLRWEDLDLHRSGPVHAVRDWILVMIGSYHWPNFNIADSLLVCGAGLLLWHAFWPRVDKAADPGLKCETSNPRSA